MEGDFEGQVLNTLVLEGSLTRRWMQSRGQRIEVVVLIQAARMLWSLKFALDCLAARGERDM